MNGESHPQELARARSLIARAGLHTTVMLVGLAGSACATDEPEPDTTEVSSEIRTVGGAVGSGCSTAVVRGLSRQIAEEVDCVDGASLVRFSPTTRIKFSSNAVLPYLHPRAKADLLRVADNHTLRINSGYRTVAQQYLLYRWFRAGRCGITAAALPGQSNHESGRAIDLANWSSRVSAMAAHHWAHSVPGDPVHFDNTRSPDLRGRDVRAFQRLWNRNHPGDKIAVDGDYGPQTAARLRRAPAKGFKKGAACRITERGADVLAIAGPDRIAPGELAHYTFTIANNDDVEWPASTRVITADGNPSPLHDASWASPNDAGALGVAIAPTADGDFTLAVRAPVVADDTAVTTVLSLVDGDRLIGSFELAVTVDSTTAGTSGDDGDDISEDNDLADEDGVVESGCSAGLGQGWLGVLAILGLGSRARRRRSTGSSSRRSRS